MNKKTTIYLVRHGQTEWNIEHRFQGHQDSPLTELGVQQAMWLGESLHNEDIDVIYSSSSNRAVKTAELINGSRTLPINKKDELKEINLGIWEGQLQDVAKEQYSQEYHAFWNDPERFQLEGAETFFDVSKRAITLLNQIVRENEGKAILIVSHTVVVKLIMAHFENRLMKDVWNPPFIHPACLCKIEIDNDEPTILLHGDITHYKQDIGVKW
ncbi:histidine phosphatase family protein [Gorillibacterium massiliense]|uniref:histidine phosphatase family protein n=1 Tax=Gorillibacterium massiliense TaxID=1280390 RepID=UPI000594C36A|nr:histidine phosphatase family protein [Gorillibacterium massiliense]